MLLRNEAAPRFLLPPSAYTDPAWLARERAELFGRTWALVAAEEDLPGPGSCVDAQVGSAALLISRQDDGGVQAAHRVGGRAGAVAGAPASIGRWGGMIFAHPEAGAAPFEQFLGQWPELIGSYRPELLTQIARVQIEGRFNWKLFVENHIDVLHLWYLHDRTLADFDHPRFEHRNLGGHWVSYEPLKGNRDPAEAAITQGTRPIEHIGERDRTGIGAHLLFPNMQMASSSEFWISYAVTPLAPDRSVVDLRVRAEPGADADALVAAARSFIDEDVFACEQVQIVLSSPRFEVGPLAFDHERPITTFHEHLLAILGGTAQ